MGPTARSADAATSRGATNGAADHHPPDHAPCTRGGDSRPSPSASPVLAPSRPRTSQSPCPPVAPTRPISCAPRRCCSSARGDAARALRGELPGALRGPTAGRGVGAPSRGARAGSRVRSELTTPPRTSATPTRSHSRTLGCRRPSRADPKPRRRGISAALPLASRHQAALRKWWQHHFQPTRHPPSSIGRRRCLMAVSTTRALSGPHGTQRRQS